MAGAPRTSVLVKALLGKEKGDVTTGSTRGDAPSAAPLLDRGSAFHAFHATPLYFRTADVSHRAIPVAFKATENRAATAVPALRPAARLPARALGIPDLSFCRTRLGTVMIYAARFPPKPGDCRGRRATVLTGRSLGTAARTAHRGGERH